MEIIKRHTDYALRAAAHLAGAGQRALSTSSLAEQEGVPVAFLRKIMQRLKNAGIVESVRGPAGGYRLACSPGDITLRNIVTAIQGPIHMNACFKEPQFCEYSGACELQNLLGEIDRELKMRLDSVTLKTIADRLERKDANALPSSPGGMGT